MEFLKKSLNKVNVQENTLYDIIYDLFFYAKLQESEENIKNGRICTLEELRQHINELEEKHANNNTSAPRRNRQSCNAPSAAER